MTRADTIARHVTQAATHIKTALALSHEPGGEVGGCVDAAARCINAAFLECLGGAAVAGEAGPEPPKPAGWVVRARHEDGRTLWASNAGTAHSESMGCAHVFPSAGGLLEREEKRWGPGWSLTVLPVDAAGNVVIEAAGEEREWEAMRADRDAFQAEAERLRGEVARLHETLRDVSALADEHANEMTGCGPHTSSAAVRAWSSSASAREAVTLIERKAFDLRTEAERLRTELAAVKAERDALAAEVQRGRKQKPVRWAFLDETGTVVCTTEARQPVSPDSGYRVAPLYLAPVVRDHSGVIAQCEEALRAWDSKGAHCSATSSLVAVTLTKARNALRGAS